MSHIIEKRNKVLSQEYINWLSVFIKKVEAFDDEPNNVHYNDNYTEDEKEKIYLVSTLFSVISEYYDKNNIEYDIEMVNFYNRGVTVNLTSDTAIEMRLWCGQGAVTDVALIEAGTGKVNMKDVVTRGLEMNDDINVNLELDEELETEEKQIINITVYSGGKLERHYADIKKIVSNDDNGFTFIDKDGNKHTIINMSVIVDYEED